MNWYVVDKNYIQYLLQFDSKVGYINYGSHLKLYLGTILEVGQFFYYVPVSSAKEKFRSFNSDKDRVNYIYFLQKER